MKYIFLFALLIYFFQQLSHIKSIEAVKIYLTIDKIENMYQQINVHGKGFLHHLEQWLKIAFHWGPFQSITLYSNYPPGHFPSHVYSVSEASPNRTVNEVDKQNTQLLGASSVNK